MVRVRCTRPDCGHEWEYSGKSKFYITCPCCYRKINVQAAIERAKEEVKSDDKS